MQGGMVWPSIKICSTIEKMANGGQMVLLY